MTKLLIPLAALALGLGACGEATFNEGDLEAKLTNQIAQAAGVRPKSVDCPSDAPSTKGSKFKCTLTAPNGDQLPVDVTVPTDGRVAFVVRRS
jgi:Domain of unknown function (DUF4333)